MPDERAEIVEAVAESLALHALPDRYSWAGLHESARELWREDARVAIEAARPMIEAEAWRPIETAPRDGTEFDVWVPNDTGGYRITNLHLRGDGGYLWDRRMSIARIARWPTHWRPPPAPPSIEPQS